MPTPSELGEYLTYLRKQRGWSIRTTASRSGISYTYLGQLERGEARNPRRPVLLTLASVFELDDRDQGILFRKAGQEAGMETTQAIVAYDPETGTIAGFTAADLRRLESFARRLAEFLEGETDGMGRADE
jgi:transcriptional regulator with XRE-family HTH domain